MSAMKEFLSNSYLFGANAPFIEELYEAYLDNPQSVPSSGAYYRQACRRRLQAETEDATWPTRRSSNLRPARPAGAARPGTRRGEKRGTIASRLGAAADRGSTAFAGCSLPTSIRSADSPRIAELEQPHDLTDADMDTVFNTGSLVGPEQASLRERDHQGAAGDLLRLPSASSTCTFQPVEKRWIQERWSRIRRSRAIRRLKRQLLRSASTAAEGLERVCTPATSGRSAFRLRRGDTLIPMLDNLLQRAGEPGVQELRARHGPPCRLNCW